MKVISEEVIWVISGRLVVLATFVQEFVVSNNDVVSDDAAKVKESQVSVL